MNHNKEENQLADGTRAQQLSLPIELSAEKIQDFQAAFSIMDSQSKGYVCPDDINRVAQAAGTTIVHRDNEDVLLFFLGRYDSSGE